MQHKVTDTSDVVIRFAGDSGDGMQLTGTLFADTSAIYGNSLSTFPDYPAEIRAPKGTVSGVSGFQVHIGSKSVNTPGDYCDLLVAMNPAALRANAKWLKRTGMVIVDQDSFDDKNLELAGFKTGEDPFEVLHIEDRTIVVSPITTLTHESLKDSTLDAKSISKCKNMFTLGMACFIYGRPLDYISQYLERKFSKKHPEMIAPNKKVLEDGFNYASNVHAIANTYEVAPMHPEKGLYRNISGNQATAWGLMAASEKSGLELFCGSYPITPATAILEELAIHKYLGVKTMQAEDEIAGICTAIGASFAGDLACTTTSGPGLSLKSEALGLAVMTELPLVVVDVQRAGPSTGIPTKTEQTDLFQALYGRNGECPIPIIAPRSPAGCFDAAFYASKVALEHMTPVIMLSEGFLGNGSEPWKIPSMADYPAINPPLVKGPCEGKFKPFERDPETMVPKWAPAGTRGYEHRVGGLEKNHDGAISSDPENHALMVAERQKKVDWIANVIPPLQVHGQKSGKLLLVGWGGTFGHLLSAFDALEGKGVSLVHFDWVNPLPKNTEEVFAGFEKILVCELNSGQFVHLLRARMPQFKFNQYNKVQGQPFLVHEIVDAALELIK